MSLTDRFLVRHLHHLPMLVILFDQAVISGSRLITQVAVGRFGPDQLGLFGSAMGVVMTMVAMQEAMVTTPFTVFAPQQTREDRPAFASGALLVQLWMMTLLLAGWAGIVIWKGSTGGWSGGVLLVMTAMIWFAPFQLVREFGRRWMLANNLPRPALMLDVISTGVLLVLLGLAAGMHWMDARLAFAIVTVANLLYVGVWLFQYRREFPVRTTSPRGFASLSWSYGRWIAGEALCSVVMMYYLVWHLTFFLGEFQAGLFQSCMTVVFLANPFLLGFVSFLGPKAATTWHQFGWPALWRLTWQSLVFVVAILAGISLFLAFAGDWLLVTIFGSEYAGNGSIVTVLGVGMIGLGVSYVVTCALQTAGRPAVNFLGSVFSGVFLVAWSWLFVREDLMTAATGFVVAVFLGVAVRFIGLWIARKSQAASDRSCPIT